MSVLSNRLGRGKATSDSKTSLWRRIYRARVLYLLVIPSLILVILFLYYPAFSAIFHSFTWWKVLYQTEWIGLDNFREMLQDRYLNASWGNLIKLTLFHVLITLTIPLFNAVAMFRLLNERLRYAYRILFVLPAVVPGIVHQLLWKSFLSRNGLINEILTVLGLGTYTRAWLGDFNLALYAIMFVGFPWAGGITVLIYLSGLLSIPGEFFDAARVDGAGSWARFRYLELPLMMSQVKLFVILTVIGSIQDFFAIFVLTEGGPGFTTLTPGLWMYQQALQYQRYGYASAIGVVLFLIILVLTLINNRYLVSTVEMTGG
jgi:raffinose/stachyose/melibiose transport system permease protein